MTKVSSATVRLVLKKLKANSLGENPIYLSVCFNGRKEKSTGVFISQKYWNAQREEIRKNCPNAPVLNKMINEMKQRVIDRRLLMLLRIYQYKTPNGRYFWYLPFFDIYHL